MTARPAAKGWCPGAYRPMASGDGLIVRVRPRLARLTADQALGLCTASAQFGSGIIDLTSRANLQVRGVNSEDHQSLIDALWSLDLLDGDPAMEERRNILAAPLWQPGDGTDRIATALAARLADLPPLPVKFGFAVDCGTARVLGAAPADIRVERGQSGGLILRPDGAELGTPVTCAGAVDAIIALAQWFSDSGGATSGRMARHLAQGARNHAAGIERPARSGAMPQPGPSPIGPVYGVAFGQIEAAALARLIGDSGALALRLSPNRTLILEGGDAVAAPEFLTDPADPLLRIDACPGAPFCRSATVETRSLARALAPLVQGSLHVSGCAKGCARARPAALTLTGRDGVFDLVKDGLAWDAPTASGLAPDTLPAVFGAS